MHSESCRPTLVPKALGAFESVTCAHDANVNTRVFDKLDKVVLEGKMDVNTPGFNLKQLDDVTQNSASRMRL